MTAPDAPECVPWRVGRHYGIHIYAETGITSGTDDEAIGTMFSPELAEAVVDAHNRLLCQRDAGVVDL